MKVDSVFILNFPFTASVSDTRADDDKAELTLSW